MKIKIKINLALYLFIIIASISFNFLYTSLVFNNDNITDSRNYFSFFTIIKNSGFLLFIGDSYASGGKLEFIFYYLYSVISNFSIFDDFYFFVFINYTIIILLTLRVFILYSKKFSTTSYLKISLFSLILSFSWFPSYLNMLWLWRTDFAYALLLLSFLHYINKKYFSFALLAIISIFSHYSSLPILTMLIFLFHFSKNINKISLGLKIIIISLFAIAGGFLYKIIKRNFVSGEGEWPSDYYLGNLILVYFFIGFLIIISILYTSRKKIPNDLYYFIISVALFSLFSFIVALSSNGNHQDITRTMHVPFLLFCIIIPLIRQYGGTLQKSILTLYISIGCIATTYIIINFFINLS